MKKFEKERTIHNRRTKNLTKCRRASLLKIIYFQNGCRIYVSGYYDREKLSSIYVAVFPRIYWSGHLSSSRGGDGLKVGMETVVILARYTVHFNKEHENLV